MAIELIFKNKNCEWIDVEGATQEDLKFLHERFGINYLLLEDTIDPNHLPKYEEDSNLKFFLMRENTELDRKNLNSISDVSTKLGIYLIDNIIITIHRLKNRSVYEVKKDILLKKEAISRDDIALSLAIKVMKFYDDEAKHTLNLIDELESEIFLQNKESPNLLRKLYRLKRKTGLNNRILNMSTDWVDKFKKLDLSDTEITDLKDKHKDVIVDYDHLNGQAINLIFMFLALSDQKANQTMKILTRFSVYFLPITFLAGLYGMNFKYMPELESEYGYYFTLALMALIVIATFIYFNTKNKS
ncbi:CorA family divalent cation transporter [Frigoriflavimonas asaccharolytica]|uniref:Magnesium transporter n=1 Tax=Frigoriflavimonas asaccharolytica TaxID=2735899 RepID=A0A8J8G8J8_9FLAO|nr:CorA family divalent cation transporter [Frigoriflavimonas asaccharolytica]NRS93294.1 magnesium transporter [Frigoriflavimonas asaccharolytica]